MVIIWSMMVNNNLVGGFNHLEKIVSVKDYHIYYGQITFMFQTNNQCIILKVNLLRISEHRPNAWKEVFLLANLG